MAGYCIAVVLCCIENKEPAQKLALNQLNNFFGSLQSHAATSLTFVRAY
jgi:hypothetical protein